MGEHWQPRRPKEPAANSPARPDIARAVHAICAELHGPVVFDEGGDLLMDAPSGRTVDLRSARIERLERRLDRVSGRPYLILLRDDGVQLVLSEHGVAFEPLRDHLPPGVEIPPVVCLSDFQRLAQRLEHQLSEHPDEEPNRERVEIAMVALGILGGARRLGFNVDRDERQLESLLGSLERQRPPG